MEPAEKGSLDAATRVLDFYLRSAWNVASKVQPLRAAEEDGVLRADRPVLTGPVLFLPDARVACPGSTDARRLYLASAAHAAAHLTWSTMRYERGKLRPLQIALVGAIEDARVERLAMQRYPGLRHWWLPFHQATADSVKTASALIARLARALLDADYADDDGWVNKGRALFDRAFNATLGLDPAISREIGNLLGNDLGQMRVQFNAKTYAQDAPYRDDNSLVWQAEPTPVAPSDDDTPAERNGSAQASGDVRDLPADDDRPTEKVADCPGDLPAAGHEVRADEGLLTVLSVARYREWDYVIRRYRANWCRVETVCAVPSSATRVSPPPDDPAEGRVRALLRSTRYRVVTGKTLAYEGDVLALDACVEGRVDARRGATDDFKAFANRRLGARSGPLAVLIDLSASSGTAGRMHGALASSCLLGRALAASERCFALYGFHSDGRERVRIHRFKDFDDRWGIEAEQRLMHAVPGLSTRFGAALRHVGEQLRPHMTEDLPGSVWVVSDGVPYDIDSFDPRYLRDDMRRAIGELKQQGIRCACLSPDDTSLETAAAMFGRNRVASLRTPADLAKALRRAT